MPLIFFLLLFALPLQAANLDSLLADNRVRAGVRADDLYRLIDHPDSSAFCCGNQFEDYRFLLANLPLSDLALMTLADLVENVELARQARRQSGWGMKYDEAMFRQFVLPHRVSQEPFVHYRKQFLDEIGPRVKGLSMGDAILEVNHWCHEKATYRPTDGRDQDPLTTIRSGFGRCEEEMILTISALRSVGIPARQCYTPYWAHSDDNHAWVEAWADGKWYYLGACEPAQELNQAWFSGPAQRAMLVVSTAYGDYPVDAPETEHNANTTCKPSTSGDAYPMRGTLGSDPVLRRYGRSTNINSTAVYGPTKELKVTVLNRKGKPAKDVRVIFSLWNYGSLMPATGVTTDENGVATLTCGIGDWFVGATQEVKTGWFGWGGKETFMAFSQIKGDQTEATLRLDAKTPEGWMTSCEYTPPEAPTQKVPEVISAEGTARGLIVVEMKELADSLFRARLGWEDSVREYDLWHFAAFPHPQRGYDKKPPQRIGYFQSQRIERSYDCIGLDFSHSSFRDSVNRHFNADTACWVNHISRKDLKLNEEFNLRDYLRKARGNWPLLHLLYDYPCNTNLVSLCGDLISPIHFESLRVLSDKDLLDYDIDMWFDHVIHACLMHRVGALDYRQWQAKCDSATFNELILNLKTTRIDFEPTIPWRKAAQDLLMKDSTLFLPNDALIKWIRENITIETSPDRLGPPLTPAQCLELRRGTEGDIERLYIGLCRVRGIPARRNPITNVVERWDDPTGWTTVNVLSNPKSKIQNPKSSGHLTISIAATDSLTAEALFMKDWALAKWEGALADVQDLGWHQPYKAISWPVELPEGWYLLSSGKRRDDGSAPVKMVWIEVKGGEEAKARLEFR